ncbi:hypothetical protein [Nitrosopumilus sp.]|uniref:hypothetical protein n=1 Tax=Nitrosopumilus sp. TaxID=2024843 RepID=UPI003D0F8CAD
MTILSSNEIPIGLRGLSIFLIGMSAICLTAFIGITMFVSDIQSGKYLVDLPSLEEFLFYPILSLLVPGIFALTASVALFSQKDYARVLIIAYGGSSLVGFLKVEHPVFLFAIVGAIVLYYMWQPHVKDYFKRLVI